MEFLALIRESEDHLEGEGREEGQEEGEIIL